MLFLKKNIDQTKYLYTTQQLGSRSVQICSRPTTLNFLKCSLFCFFIANTYSTLRERYILSFLQKEDFR